VKRVKKTRAEAIATIRRRDMYLSGNEFTTYDMESNLKDDYCHVGTALLEMHRQGLLDQRLQHFGLKSTAYWSRRSNVLLRQSWRSVSNDELLLDESLGSL
jgi:hypothetical protein